MIRKCFAICAVATGLWGVRLAAQTPVPIDREPRHRLVWRDGPVRVFDVRIQPGDTSLYHIHDTAILYVPISISPTDAQILGGQWAGVGRTDSSRFRPDATESDTLYATRPVTHRVTNVGSRLFRLIAVTNARLRGTGASLLPDSALPGRLERSSSWFRQSRLALEVGESSAWYTASLPTVLVQPAEGRARVNRTSSGAAGELNEAGSWVYLPAGARFRVRNEGDRPTSIVIVQAR